MAKQIIVYFTALMLLLHACRKADNNQVVPAIPTDITISLANPLYMNLNQIGGFAYIPNVGYKGIVVQCINTDQWVAFDRACSYAPNQACHLVTVDTAQVFALKCTCCSSKWASDGGVPIQAPANMRLGAFKVNYLSSTNQLRIFN